MEDAIKPTDQPGILTLAQCRGLGSALVLFPEDVQVAIATAQKMRQAITPLLDSTVEPWPPMQVKGAP